MHCEAEQKKEKPVRLSAGKAPFTAFGSNKKFAPK
jgi:hypothetical protein